MMSGVKYLEVPDPNALLAVVQYIYPMVAFYSVDKTQILDICNTSLYRWNYHRRQVAAAFGRICAAEIKRFGFVVVDS